MILYGLRSADAVVAESRRFELALATPRAVREFLATTGETGVDYAYEQIAARAADDTADAFVDAVAALDTPALPATILRLTTIPALYVSARTWIEARFDRSLAALAAASGGTSAVSETANEILRRFARREHPGAVAALARKSGHDERRRTDAGPHAVRPALGDVDRTRARAARASRRGSTATRRSVLWSEGVAMPAWMPGRYAIPPAMERAEAVFWFFAATSSSAAEVRALDVDRAVAMQDVRARIRRTFRPY